MSRVNWVGLERVMRLSAFAAELLTHLCADGARLEFERESGGFWLTINGTRYRRVGQRNVEVLVAPRLVSRDRTSTKPVYVITERGFELMRSRAIETCARAGGRACGACQFHACPFLDAPE